MKTSPYLNNKLAITRSLAKTAINVFDLKFFIKFEVGSSIEDLS